MPITPVPGSCVSCGGTDSGDETPVALQSVQHANVGTFTLAAAAHAATAGFAWLINPVGSGVILDLRKVWVAPGPGTAPLVIAAPTNVTMERVSFTGTAAGATVTPAPRDTAQPAAVGSVRTASTGLTLAAGPVAHSFQTAQLIGTLGLTAGAASVVIDQEWPGNLDSNDQIVLRPGEGVVFRQATAGATLLESRTIDIDITWDERTS